jgi:Polysaccharide biosynthesis enzyme WcbI
MMAGRRLTIGFIGNCQAELLQKAFLRAVPASDFATFYHFFNIDDDKRAEARADLARCDVLLMQDIQDVELYPLQTAVPPGVKILPFPFIRFASPWPFDDFNGLRDGMARNQDDPSLHTTTYYDGVLGRLRRLHPEPQVRFEAYKALNLEARIDPLRVHDFEIRRLEALDERFGFQIGRLILDGFRKTQLFYTVNRPCGAVLGLVLDHLFKALDLDYYRSLDPNGSCDQALDELRSIQVPVHPLVAKRLDIEWADETRLYRNGERERTWEDFVRAYIERYG